MLLTALFPCSPLWQQPYYTTWHPSAWQMGCSGMLLPLLAFPMGLEWVQVTIPHCCLNGSYQPLPNPPTSHCRIPAKSSQSHFAPGFSQACNFFYCCPFNSSPSVFWPRCCCAFQIFGALQLLHNSSLQAHWHLLGSAEFSTPLLSVRSLPAKSLHLAMPPFRFSTPWLGKAAEGAEQTHTFPQYPTILFIAKKSNQDLFELQ